MEYQDYAKYVGFVFSEELERIEEYVYAVHEASLLSVQAPWTQELEYIPSKEELEKMFAGRDIAADMAVINSGNVSTPEAEQLWLDLRDLI
jgi:hypothetical protein